MIPADHAYTYTQTLMGTPVLLKWFVHNDALADEVFAKIKQLEDALTVNRPHSEIMDINRAAGRHPVRVSPVVFKLIQRAKDASVSEGSCFNLAIGPVVKRWKIGFQGNTVPPADEIKKLLALTDPYQVILDPEDHSVFLEKPGMEIDLGAIAKGYIADIVKDFLYQHGIRHALVNLGGNVQTLGGPQTGPCKHWAIGLQKPFTGRGELIGIIHVVDKSVVTSGIYERCFIAGETLYHHIFDPRTGFPLDNELVSVTVISDTSIDGEIYTTLLYGMGVEKGLAFLSSLPDIEAVFVTRDRKIILSSRRQFTFALLDPDYTLED